MHCPNCATELPEGAVFCVECGTDLASFNMAEPPEQTAGSSEAQSAGDKPTKKRSAARIALIAALAVLILGAAGFAAIKLFPRTYESTELTLTVSTDKLGKDFSPIPFRLKGKTFEGNDVDKLLTSEDLTTTIELERGSYTLEMAGSPVAEDGTIFSIPKTSYTIEFSGEEPTPSVSSGSGESNSSTEEKASSSEKNTIEELEFTLESIAAEDVTDEDLAAIENWMKEAELSDTDTFVQKAEKARDDRLAEIEEEKKAAEEAERKAKEEARAQKIADAKAENSTGLTIDLYNSQDVPTLTYTGTLRKEIIEVSAFPDKEGEPNYLLDLDSPVSITFIPPMGVADGYTELPLNESVVGVRVGYDADLEAHLGETVTCEGPFVFSARALYVYSDINIEAEYLTAYDD